MATPGPFAGQDLVIRACCKVVIMGITYGALLATRTLTFRDRRA